MNNSLANLVFGDRIEAEEILDKVKKFLAARGMEVSEQKTKLTATTDGFDFLGFNFKVQKNGK
jgi:RNA-directed DNA polymerase